jgi:SAM-dependent methyltransferase
MTLTHDPLYPISRRSQQRHYGTIFPFMRRALLPEPSPNQSPFRFDIAILDSLINPKAFTTILDLGCGEWLLFEKLLKLHDTGDSGHLFAPCKYFSIDSTFDDLDPKWLKLKRGSCSKCFPEPIHLQLSLNHHEMLSDLVRELPLDLVVLSNVLHELAPDRWLKLLALVFSWLSADGKLVLIDPDLTWSISRDAWAASSSNWDLASIAVEWETDAVWLSRESIREILSSFGFAATVHPYERKSLTLWMATGSRPTADATPDIARALESLRAQLNHQVESERDRIAGMRNDLRAHFRKSAGMSGELLVRTFEFFAACASQCRRLEALEDLSK